MKINYKIQDKFDFLLFFSALALVSIGLLAIYSSTINHPNVTGNFEKQLTFFFISLFVFFVVYLIPTNTIRFLSIPAYLAGLFFLIIVLVIGKEVSGQKSWLDLGFLGFQPSEFAKIGTILALAYYLSRNNINIDSFKDLAVTILIGMVPVFLILLEPDLGSAIVYFGLILAVIFWKGISLFSLFVVLTPCIVAFSALFGTYPFIGVLALVIIALIFFRKDIFISGSIFALNLAAGFFTDYIYRALKPHQQKRIEAFIDPFSDPLGSGYNAIQARVAIGSGGLTGKGFLSGNQTQLQYIPEQWTDFIFCVIGEEFGFIGSILLLTCFMILFFRAIKIASTAKDEFASLTIIGILSVYFFHWLINIGMTVGVVPVIGIPLPFVSYGGTSLLTNMFMLGIVANIYRTRKEHT